jgi:hypothetical protein
MFEKASQRIFLGVSLVLLVAISVIGFSKNAGHLFPGGDGLLALRGIAQLQGWLPPGFYSSADMLQGFGDIAWPINYAFEPGYQLSLLIFGLGSSYALESQVFISTVLAIELFLATFVASRCFGFSWFVSVLAAWASPLLMLPYFGFSRLYPLLVFAPHYGTLIGENLLALAAFACVGRSASVGGRRFWKDALLCAAILLMLAHVTLLNPVAVAMWLPLQAVVGGGLLVSSKDRRELRSKIVVAAVLSLICLATFGAFLYGQFAYAVATFWPAELENQLQQWQFVSTWFRPLEVTGKILIGMALVGMLLAMFDRSMRAIAASTLAFVLFLVFLGCLTIYFDLWRGPSPVYLEMLIDPLYAMFAAYAVAGAGALVAMAVRRYRPRAEMAPRRLQAIGSGIAIAIIPAVALVGVWHVDRVPRIYGPAPPTRPPIVAFLEDKIAIKHKAAFRGRVATFLLQNREEAAGWVDLIMVNAARVDNTGNDYFWSGLWPLWIPTLFEYNQIMSPAFFRTAVDLWARPGDKQMRNVIVLRRADARTLALFGVRFVVSDAPLPAPFQLETSEATSSKEMLYLSEVPDVNLGDYSPTEIQVVGTFRDALDTILKPGFDGRRTAILFNDESRLLPAKLVPAANVQVVVEQGGLDVKASSADTSLLVLPFEFSNCLTIHLVGADGPMPRVVRTDGALTGVLFSKQVHVPSPTSPARSLSRPAASRTRRSSAD